MVITISISVVPLLILVLLALFFFGGFFFFFGWAEEGIR